MVCGKTLSYWKEEAQELGLDSLPIIQNINKTPSL